jgi:hypothetical protein
MFDDFKRSNELFNLRRNFMGKDFHISAAK